MENGIRRRAFLTAIGAMAATAGLALPTVQRSNRERKVALAGPLPNAHPGSTTMAAAVQAISRETNGDVVLDYFPNSMLGNEANIFVQLQTGAIEFAMTSASFLSTIVPSAGLPCMAYAFDGYEQLWGALDGDLGDHINAELGRIGLTVIGVVDNGFRDITTSDRLIRTPDDLHGVKLRVPPSPLYISLFSALGAAPTTLSVGELYTSLQTRVADGMEGSLIFMDSLHVPEVQKNLSSTRHNWEGLWLITRSDYWNGLSGDIRSIIKSNLDRALTSEHAAFTGLEKDIERRFAEKNMDIIHPDRAEFRKKLVESNYYEMWRSRFGQRSWDELEKYAQSLGS